MQLLFYEIDLKFGIGLRLCKALLKLGLSVTLYFYNDVLGLLIYLAPFY